MDEYKGLFREHRDEINRVFVKDTEECIGMCFDFLNKLEQLDNDNAGVVFNIWFCYYTLAELYYNIKNYTRSLNYVDESLKYTQLKECRYKSIWIAALSYESLENNEKALKIYDECLEYYCNIQSKKDIAIILRNKAEILKDIDMLLDAIELYNRLDLNTEGIKQETYNRHLDSAHRLLIDLYIEKSNYFLARKYISNIKNTQLKNKYCELINGNLLLV